MFRKKWEKLTDKELLAVYCSGDDNALAFFFLDRHLDFMLAKANKIAGTNKFFKQNKSLDPLHLVHNAVLSILRSHRNEERKRKDCKLYQTVSIGWFTRILSNKVIDHLRSLEQQFRNKLNPKDLELMIYSNDDNEFWREKEKIHDRCIEKLDSELSKFLNFTYLNEKKILQMF